ncbi:PREDICTED: uncharacterized protein LOC105580640 isoform X2 [Cercocebus atys]|uniref:uncharacterized protein LOC105580640 isoform X2 n=1 Tax=Cercocebus atys TaxID=9531 RepID=UPI0005F4F2DB|nr:PREDICTED: uncharacterized protein LOC105580640 isoform X2 [Cercocebus atys]
MATAPGGLGCSGPERNLLSGMKSQGGGWWLNGHSYLLNGLDFANLSAVGRPCQETLSARQSDSVVLCLHSSRRKPGGGLLPWTTPWRGFWTCWRAAGAGGERAPPWRPGSPASCSAGYRHSHARALPSLRLKQLQARAIRVLTESPPSLVAPLTSIFQLQDADRSCLLVHVHRLHQEGRFREAVMLGTTLKLQPELDVEKMSVPLLLQDKVALVERYVAGFPDLQRRLLALMDSWCQPGFDIKDVASFWKHLVCDICQQLQRKGST